MTPFHHAMAPAGKTSEDRFMIRPIEAGWLLGVADGAGGVAGGARAAELFVDGVLQATALAALDVTSEVAWIRLFERIDQAILKDPRGGETTGVALAVTPSGLSGASCGDSQALLVTPTELYDLTEGQARRPRFGTGRAKPHYFSLEAPFSLEATRGTLVMATDGLFDYASIEEIAETARTDVDDVAEALLRLVVGRYRAPPDDITVVAGRLEQTRRLRRFVGVEPL